MMNLASLFLVFILLQWASADCNLPYLEHGTVTLTTDTGVAGVAETGDVATVSCLENYTLTTDSTILSATCLVTGFWDQTFLAACEWGRAVDLESLRTKAKDGAKDQDYWFDFQYSGTSQLGLTIGLVIGTIFFASVCSFGAYACFDCLIGSRLRRERMREKGLNPDNKEDVQAFEEEEERIAYEEEIAKNPALAQEEDDLIGLSFKMQGRNWQLMD